MLMSLIVFRFLKNDGIVRIPLTPPAVLGEVGQAMNCDI